MFSFFNKKEINIEEVQSFWDWFIINEQWIIKCIENQDSSFIWLIDERLRLVFPYYKKDLEFMLGYKDGHGEFIFFHFGKKDLIRDGKIFVTMMPKELSVRWTCLLEK